MNATDSSCPKFAEHGWHLIAVRASGGGGFPVMPRLADLHRAGRP